MIIKLIRDNGRNPFKNAILAECLLKFGTISVRDAYAIVNLPEWVDFCNCVLKAAADCSRDSRGSYFDEDLIVNVEHENGRTYYVRVSIFANLNGLRYGSISR